MKFNFTKKITLAIASFAAVAFIATGVSHADIPYSGPTTPPSPVPAFNVFSGSNLPAPMPSNGEQDFFQGRVPVNGNMNEGTTPFTDPVNSSCTNNQIIQLHIYVHNGASQYENNNGTGQSVMHGAKVQVALPDANTAATTFSPTATLSANNATTISDKVSIICNGQPVELQYITGSASQYSIGSGVLPLSDSIITSGASIQSEKVPGDVWGCWDERVYVVLAVKVVVPQKPPVPPTCNLITLDSDYRTVRVKSVGFTAGDSTVANLMLDFGDGNKATIKTSQLPYSHVYSADGTYHVRVTLDTSTGYVTSNGCVAIVTIKNQPVNPVTPVTPPKNLVNTGPGDMIGIFAAVTLIAALAHRAYMRVFSAK